MVFILPYEPKDSHAMELLVRDFFAWQQRLLGNHSSLDGAEASLVTAEDLLTPNSWIIVAEEETEKRLVGFVRWEKREGAFLGREIFVNPDDRHQGIGTRLQEEVERCVRQAGGEALFVSILPQNRSMLRFAFQRGYDTLNTVELRKDLTARRAKRGRISLFGLHFRVL